MRARHKVSRAGVELIKSFEGLRTTAARLPDGRWTLGYGHTFSARDGARVTQEDADALLRFDLLPIVDSINSLVLTQLNQNQFDALVSFCFNIGADNFAQSTVLKRINEGRFADAALAMDSWRSAEFNGQTYVLAPLIRRRAAEKNLFLTPEDISQSAASLGRPVEDAPYAPPPVETPAPYTPPVQAYTPPPAAPSVADPRYVNPYATPTPPAAPVTPPTYERQIIDLGAPYPAAPQAPSAEKPTIVRVADISPYAPQAEQVVEQLPQGLLSNSVMRETPPAAPVNPYVEPQMSAEVQAAIARAQDEKRLEEQRQQEQRARDEALVAARAAEDARLLEEARLREEARVREDMRIQEMARQEAARQEAARLEQARAEQVRLEQERMDQWRAEQIRLEQQRLEDERAEQLRQDAVRQEQIRIEAVRIEQERVERERQEQARLEQERLEQARVQEEKWEQARQERERLDREAAEQARLEQERIEAARQAQERLEQERQIQERQAQAQRDAEENARQQAAVQPAPAQPGQLTPEEEAEKQRKAEAASALMRLYSPYGGGTLGRPLSGSPSPAPTAAQAPVAAPAPSPEPEPTFTQHSVISPSPVESTPFQLSSRAEPVAAPVVEDDDDGPPVVSFTPGNPSKMPPPVVTALNPYAKPIPAAAPTPAPDQVIEVPRPAPMNLSAPSNAPHAAEVAGLNWREQMQRPLPQDYEAPAYQATQAVQPQAQAQAAAQPEQPFLRAGPSSNFQNGHYAEAYEDDSEAWMMNGERIALSSEEHEEEGATWWEMIVKTVWAMVVSAIGLGCLGVATGAWWQATHDQSVIRNGVAESYTFLSIATAAIGILFVSISVWLIMKRLGGLKD